MDENLQMFRERTVKLHIQQEHFHISLRIIGSIRNVENASFRSTDGRCDTNINQKFLLCGREDSMCRDVRKKIVEDII
jgi:hypothetical protein